MGLDRFSAERFLLCEGDDDKGVLETLIRARNLPKFQICHAAECSPGVGGIGGFTKAIAGMPVISGFRDVKAFLLVADNDSFGISFSAVQRALSENGHSPPPGPTEVGRIHHKPVAILMIPTHNEVGDLEALCLPAIHERWPGSVQCVNNFLECTQAVNWQKRSSISKARARAAAVGFNEDDPYKGIGHLFRNATLSADNGCFDGIADFLANFDRMCGI